MIKYQTGHVDLVCFLVLQYFYWQSFYRAHRIQILEKHVVDFMDVNKMNAELRISNLFTSLLLFGVKTSQKSQNHHLPTTHRQPTEQTFKFCCEGMNRD